MIKGILLGISLAIFITSLIFIVAGLSGILQENLVTGAAIGTSGAISYALIFLILSLVTIFFLALIMRSKFK